MIAFRPIGPDDLEQLELERVVADARRDLARRHFVLQDASIVVGGDAAAAMTHEERLEAIERALPGYRSLW